MTQKRTKEREAGLARFEIFPADIFRGFRSASGIRGVRTLSGWRWRLRAANNRIVTTGGELFTGRSGKSHARRACRMVERMIYNLRPLPIVAKGK